MPLPSCGLTAYMHYQLQPKRCHGMFLSCMLIRLVVLHQGNLRAGNQSMASGVRLRLCNDVSYVMAPSRSQNGPNAPAVRRGRRRWRNPSIRIQRENRERRNRLTVVRMAAEGFKWSTSMQQLGNGKCIP
ncbi:hypothetical protein L345_07270, partial [Ophiophagus hannah]